MNFYLPKKESEFVKAQGKDFLRDLVRAYMDFPIEVAERPERPHGPEPRGPGLPRYGK